jgi:hypothetical protein
LRDAWAFIASSSTALEGSFATEELNPSEAFINIGILDRVVGYRKMGQISLGWSA